MSELNKYLGAGLATALGLMAVNQLPHLVFPSHTPHHDKHGEGTMTLTQKMCDQFAYCVEIAEASAGPAETEPAFDLGAALAQADLTRGERVFAGQCSTCHTINNGGNNGTGPNLWNTVGSDKAAHAGFNYSAALAAMDGVWSYENLDAWLKAPSSYVKGTTMSFAGIRRDADRAAVIAYLAANTENPPPFPAPLAAAPAEPAGEAAADGTAPAADTVDTTGDSVPAPVEPAAAAPVQPT